MKMTDQMERDYFDAEMASGRAGRKEGFDADGLKVALVIGAVLFAAILMISLGR